MKKKKHVNQEYQMKLFFINKGQQKLKEFSTIRPALQMMLKGDLHTEIKVTIIMKTC